jgi:Leucine-rich repeat (LRR) protein
MSYNNFNGSIPNSIANLTKLVHLDMSNNNFSGSIPDLKIANLTQLDFLDLSHNKFNGSIPNSIASLTQLVSLLMSHNNFGGSIPDSTIASLTKLVFLDMSNNNFTGSIPNSIASLTQLVSLDMSNNNFSGSIPDSIASLKQSSLIDLSSNQIHGEIPISICNAIKLEALVLSNNSFFGTIPQCLIELSSKALVVLNLRTNNLNGTIPDAFSSNCGLQTLALNKNQLKGGLPKSLANCSRLEVLDIGNNHIEDTFPFYLKNTSLLRVLVLRSNKFYGRITHPEPNATWPMLQIIDVASNNFIGNLPIILLSNWMAMVNGAQEAQSEPNQLEATVGDHYYQDSVTVTIKGLELELVKILTIFTTIDFSCNGFDGPIPEEIGELKALHTLNLSHNAFTGQIPSSLGKLSNLESLDLSSNELSGKIPVQLADGLTFLAVLNLSFNHLVGQIPFIKQFAAFPETSFKGNGRLCGFPLKSQCTSEKPWLSPPTHAEKHWTSRIAIEWNYISAELGFIFGTGIVIGPLMFWKRWRICYYKCVDDILFKSFPRLYLGIEYYQRRRYRNQRQRH